MSGEDNRVYGIYSGSELTIVPTQQGVPSAVSDAKYVVGENVNIRRKSSGMILVTGCFLPIAASAQDMSIKSAEVSEGAPIKEEQVFKGFGCTGSNISPSLSWSGASNGTKSFAITVYDPDAPTGSSWWRWVVFNIPVATTSIPKNAGDLQAKSMPADAIQSRTDFGIGGYGGPARADEHHVCTSVTLIVSEFRSCWQ